MTPVADSSTSAAVSPLIQRHVDMPGGLIPLLHAIQDRLGYVPPESVPTIAAALNLSRAEVHGVISFYHHFRSEKAGRFVVKICQAESCQAMGSDALTSHAEARLCVAMHETDGKRRYTLEPVYCLGNCACSPAIMINDDVHGRVSPRRFDEIIGHLEAQS